ncbi:MAG: short-chain dehydrogenase, partial [Actinobacteria bacterium]|nr:short-chain dehydrogenase [Actinomycetota bacterium]
MTNRTMTDLFSMKGRVAIVTGGGTHLGTAFTEALSELGAHV